jgi:hypothetical protein
MGSSKTTIPDNTRKDPDEWVSGDEPMTGAQTSYLKTLSEQANEPEMFEEGLTKAEASKRIDELRNRSTSGPRSLLRHNNGERDGEETILETSGLTDRPKRPSQGEPKIQAPRRRVLDKGRAQGAEGSREEKHAYGGS